MAFIRKSSKQTLIALLDEVPCPRCGSKEHDTSITAKVESAKLLCRICKHVWIYGLQGEAK